MALHGYLKRIYFEVCLFLCVHAVAKCSLLGNECTSGTGWGQVLILPCLSWVIQWVHKMISHHCLSQFSTPPISKLKNSPPHHSLVNIAFIWFYLVIEASVSDSVMLCWWDPNQWCQSKYSLMLKAYGCVPYNFTTAFEIFAIIWRVF